MDNNYLSHYGVPGMHWGYRKHIKRTSRLANKYSESMFRARQYAKIGNSKQNDHEKHKYYDKSVKQYNKGITYHKIKYAKARQKYKEYEQRLIKKYGTTVFSEKINEYAATKRGAKYLNRMALEKYAIEIGHEVQGQTLDEHELFMRTRK